MPSYQTGKNVIVGYKVEATTNTAPGATGAKQLRLTPSPGLALKKANIQSQEMRSDGLTSMGRHGSRMAEGSYSGELAVGAFDELLEAVMRSTWVASFTVTEADVTSITTTSSTIVAASGSWITEGIRVGDIVRLTNHSTAANNSKNLRVLGVTATTITVPTGDLTADAVADTTFTLTVLKKLKNGATPTRRTFYVEEYNQDIDQSEVFGGCRVVSMRITGQPDGMALVEFGLLGLSSDTLATGAAPYYTSPTLNTATALVFADAVIRFNGADVGTATGFELNYQIGAATQPVIGATVSPDVFDNSASLSGSISLIRSTLGNVDLFHDETEVELHVLLVEPESEPKDCIGIYVPRVKLTEATKSLGGEGAMIDTFPFTAGAKEAATGYDATLLTISTSAS